MDQKLAQLMAAVIKYDHGDVKRIQHLIKVHDLCLTIGLMENMPADELWTLEAAAMLHDIGIHAGEAKHGGKCTGKHQEEEGPAVAQEILDSVGGFSAQQAERIKYLIAHHHTYNDIQGLDYQILVEADFLVNLYEDGEPLSAVEKVQERIFKTASGLAVLKSMYY
ncbi:MAG: HD domain-containing protein [Selenomonadaceae bacterium]|nr:HD domain-containing protein [Selenomonadaceae bacterium]